MADKQPGAIANGGWQVGTQVRQKGKDATGNFVDGYRIHFVTDSGVAGDIWVPDPVYASADTVRARIAQAVAQINAVQNLKG